MNACNSFERFVAVPARAAWAKDISKISSG